MQRLTQSQTNQRYLPQKGETFEKDIAILTHGQGLILEYRVYQSTSKADFSKYPFRFAKMC